MELEAMDELTMLGSPFEGGDLAASAWEMAWYSAEMGVVSGSTLVISTGLGGVVSLRIGNCLNQGCSFTSEALMRSSECLTSILRMRSLARGGKDRENLGLAEAMLCEAYFARTLALTPDLKGVFPISIS